ncbi:bifunctional aminoglycoside phosphotransferase/ATP-binding protein [Trichothermofontia sp.]
MSETDLPHAPKLPLIAQMQQPAFYPHPVQLPIALIQTHVSYVFLTGDYAYKVKKPVNFGFLDYSTLEKRRHFCQEELRLNQRGAEDLYLDVLPITLDSDIYQLNGRGEAVEYVLRMRQFPQSALLLNQFEKGQVTVAQMQTLAAVVADFHARSITNDHIRSYGTVAQIRRAIDENFQQTTGYIERDGHGPQTRQQYDETQAYCDRFFQVHADWFEHRLTADRIRECHGDLHLRNICFWHDQFYLFDCIEFNEPFRFVDVMYDVAFTVMDLEARDRPDLANAFLNAYLEQTGDWQGLQVLPLYLSRQAYVRAKVTSFLLDDPSVGEAEKQIAWQTAAHYYHLAWHYTRMGQGQIIMMSGLSGSGKSTVARILARHLGAIHLRSDAVRKHLAGIPLRQRGGDDLYTPDMTAKTYDRLCQLGCQLASQGYSVILDAKYDRQTLRQAVLTQAADQGIPVHILHCHAPLAVLTERLHQRTDDVADATVSILRHQSLEPYNEAERPLVIQVETDRPLADLEAAVHALPLALSQG